MDKIVRIKKHEVTSFINEINKINRKNFIVLRRYNESDKDPYVLLKKLDYDISDLIDEINNLKVEDFLECQLDSKNKFLFMYTFIKMIKEYVVYIKLSIVQKNNNNVYVISFHEAEKNQLSDRPFK